MEANEQLQEQVYALKVELVRLKGELTQMTIQRNHLYSMALMWGMALGKTRDEIDKS
jgi:hypothetical protein